MTQDDEHLRLLAIAHRVLGGLCCLFALFPMFYVAMGLLFASGGFAGGKPEERLPAAFMGAMFIGLGGFFLVTLMAYAVALFLAAKYLTERRRHTFCVVVAAVSCAFQPIGTVLGVLALIVLFRPSVKALFGVGPDPGTPAAPA
jgi:hypothetical protein